MKLNEKFLLRESLIEIVNIAFQMLRRQARLRREYIYRKSVEQRQKTIEDKKKRLKEAIDGKKRKCFCSNDGKRIFS